MRKAGGEVGVGNRAAGKGSAQLALHQAGGGTVGPASGLGKG